MKEFVYFSKTDVFVPVSQLSTRDLFDFLGNLKIKQDIFFLSWISRRVRSVEQRALWYPYSRLFFGIVFKKMSFLEYIYMLQSQLWCPSWIFWHISFRKMFEWMTCKMRIIIFESWARCRECLLFKRLSWHGKCLFLFKILSLLFLERKESKSRFWGDGIFFWTW